MARLSTPAALIAGWALAFTLSGPAAVHAASSGCVASTDSAYTYQLTPLADFVFYWTLDGTTLKGKVVYAGEAWVAVGPSAEGEMVDSEVVLGLPDAGTVKKYSLTAESSSGVNEMSSAHQTLSATSISSSSSSTSMVFEKATSETDELEISTTGSTILVFAYGTSTSLGYHSARGAATVNLATCEATAITSKTISKFGVFAHAALMIGAWMWLVPAGVLTAVYKHKLGPGWIKLHLTLQTAAFAAMLCAFGVMYASLEDAGGQHFTTADTDFGNHTLLGALALFLMAAYQVLSGYLRPHPAPKGEPKPLSRAAFELTHKSVGRAAPVVALLAVLSGVAWADRLRLVEHPAAYVAAAVVPFGSFAVAYAYKVGTRGI